MHNEWSLEVKFRSTNSVESKNGKNVFTFNARAPNNFPIKKNCDAKMRWSWAYVYPSTVFNGFLRILLLSEVFFSITFCIHKKHVDTLEMCETPKWSHVFLQIITTEIWTDDLITSSQLGNEPFTWLTIRRIEYQERHRLPIISERKQNFGFNGKKMSPIKFFVRFYRRHIFFPLVLVCE